MTQEEAKELLPIIKAYSEGKTIQIYYSDKWEDLEEPEFKGGVDGYRIKPEYRPFKNAEECFKAIKKHGSWVKHTVRGHYHQITNIGGGLLFFGNERCIYNDATSYYVWADDGTPVGIWEE